MQNINYHSLLSIMYLCCSYLEDEVRYASVWSKHMKDILAWCKYLGGTKQQYPHILPHHTFLQCC